MTKKLFTLVAMIISNLNVNHSTKSQIADAFAQEFSKHNSRFDHSRFKDACLK